MPDVDLDVINFSKSNIDPIFTSIIPNLLDESSLITNNQFQEFFYGTDLPMTIVNNDWFWSPNSFSNPPLDKIIYKTSYTSESDSTPFGNYHVYEQSINSTQIPFASLNLNHELHKAKKRIDSFEPFSYPPGESSTLNEISICSKNDSSHSNTKKSRYQSSTSINKPEKKPSIFSTKSFRSSSADGNSKSTASQPRKVFLYTIPGFDGLGIHIACDRKSRCSSYIYEIEPNSPGAKAGLKEKDYILQINDEDVVYLDFDQLIKKIQTLIKENSLSITVGNEKAFKKWVKTHKKK